MPRYSIPDFQKKKVFWHIKILGSRTEGLFLLRQFKQMVHRARFVQWMMHIESHILNQNSDVKFSINNFKSKIHFLEQANLLSRCCL